MFGILWAFLLFMGVMMMRLRHHESSYCLALFPLFLTFPYCVAVTVGEYKSLAQIDGTRGTPLQWFLWPPGLHDLWFLHRCTEITLLLYHHHQNKWQICTHSLEVVHRPAVFFESHAHATFCLPKFKLTQKKRCLLLIASGTVLHHSFILVDVWCNEQAVIVC